MLGKGDDAGVRMRQAYRSNHVDARPVRILPVSHRTRHSRDSFSLHCDLLTQQRDFVSGRAVFDEQLGEAELNDLLAATVPRAQVADARAPIAFDALFDARRNPQSSRETCLKCGAAR